MPVGAADQSLFYPRFQQVAVGAPAAAAAVGVNEALGGQFAAVAAAAAHAASALAQHLYHQPPQTTQHQAASLHPMYNPYMPEPQLQSTNLRPGVPQPNGLMANGWEPLSIAPSPKAVIPGVSTNAVGKNYRVSHKIGMGSFGEIFLGIDVRTNERIAIKVENRSTKYPQLLDEYAVYRAVAKGIGVPSAIWCGSNTNVHIMVMDLLGDSLETLYNTCGRKFSLKTITMLAIQLLHRIEHHHNHHYLHRDIKPDNFLMGPPQSTNAHILYMVDMGLCKKYRDDATLNHIPYRENKKLIGTPRYASINTHQGIEQCRRDDLESIGYMLVYFFAGRLPWQGLKAKTKQEKYDKISQSKVNITTAELCKGAPLAFRTYLDYTRQLRFIQKPDYKYLRSLFYDLFRSNGWKDDCIYDWMLPKGVAPEPTLTRAPAQHASAAAAYQQHQQQQQNQVAAAQQLANSAMMNHFLYNARSAAPTPGATPALSRAATPQQQQQQQQQQVFTPQQAGAMAQLLAQQVQNYITPVSTPRAGVPAAVQQVTKPSPPAPVDPTIEMRRRISALERQLEEQRSLASEWKMLFEKGQSTIAAQQKVISGLKSAMPPPAASHLTNSYLQANHAMLLQEKAADAPIPLASAASLKRRRTAAHGEGETAATDEEDGSAKKSRRRV